MSSSVDISDRTKSQLEALQAKIRAETGREVSKRELVDRLVEREYGSKDAIIESFRDESNSRSDGGTPLSDEEIEAFLSGTFASGDVTDEQDIDEILYG